MDLNRRLMVAVAALALTLTVGSAEAAAIFSNLGAGVPPFDALSATVVRDNNYAAVNFSPSTTAQLTEVLIPAYRSGAPVAALQVLLREDASGPTGAILETWSLTAADLQAMGVATTPKVLTSISNPLLDASKTYWLVAQTLAAEPDRYGWHSNNQGLLGVTLSTNAGSSWYFSSPLATPAFQINGAPIPEPTSMLLLGTGLAAVLARRRFRA